MRRYVIGEWNENKDSAVSPVIGVMLMLVVTIIIAAVVSGFAGGLMGGSNQKAPTLSMDIKFDNSGSGITNFSATVNSVSESIPTRNIKIVTSWTTTNSSGSVYGGATVIKGSNAPWGFGPGVESQTADNTFSNPNSSFGNYTLKAGTGLVANSTDLKKILGTGYGDLKVGDTITVNVFYIPAGKMIFQKDIVLN